MMALAHKDTLKYPSRVSGKPWGREKLLPHTVKPRPSEWAGGTPCWRGH